MYFYELRNELRYSGVGDAAVFKLDRDLNAIHGALPSRRINYINANYKWERPQLQDAHVRHKTHPN